MAATGRHEVPLPFVHEHAARQEPPGKFVRFARMQDQGGPGVHFVIGYPAKGGGRVQSIRFDTMRYDVKQARAWLRKHGFKATGLEAAKPRRNPAMRTKTVRPRNLSDRFDLEDHERNGTRIVPYRVEVTSYRVVDGEFIDAVEVDVFRDGRVLDPDGFTADLWHRAALVSEATIHEKVERDARKRGLIP